jgi:hypothetical protein
MKSDAPKTLHVFDSATGLTASLVDFVSVLLAADDRTTSSFSMIGQGSLVKIRQQRIALAALENTHRDG